MKKSVIQKLFQALSNKILVFAGVDAKSITMVFTLTKTNGRWLIDYVGHDASRMDSFFRQ